MSQLDMAMAVNGSHVHSGPTSQAPENCWSTSGWEHQSLADSSSMEGSGGGGDYVGSGRMPEWELKANSWEWENLTMVYPRQQQQELQGSNNNNNNNNNNSNNNSNNNVISHHQRLPQNSSSDWASAVTLASSPTGSPKTGSFSIGLGSGCSTPSGTSVSSGIPGVSAGHSPLVKSEPDVERSTTVIGTPASLSAPKDRLFFSLGGVSNDERPTAEKAQSNGGGDSLNIGLKLGRRTYFEDSSGGSGPTKGEGAQAALSSPPGKKPRVMSPSTLIARCQVEGCKADLSGCKDYHRRHKVCEMHSKAPKAIANGIEQRFCQQCSRFHVLTEFDEGKRSCRRRLAGHNERRRKPHPETHSIFGLRNSSALHSDTSSLSMDSAPFYFLDSKRSNFLHRHRGSSLEAEFHAYADVKRTNPWSMIRGDDSSLACQLQAASTERQSIFSTMSRPTADRLLMLLQNPKSTQMAAPNATSSPTVGMNNINSSSNNNIGGSSSHFLQEGPGPLVGGTLGQGLSLSSSTTGGGGVGVLGPGTCLQQDSLSRGTLQGSCTQSVSTVQSGLQSNSNSGRALSLLSSQSWAPAPSRGPPPGHHPAAAGAAADLSQQDSTLEQLVASSSTDSSNRADHHRARFSHHLQPLPSLDHSSGLLTAHSPRTNNTQECNNNNSNSISNSNNIMSGLGGYDETTNSMLALVQAGQDLQALQTTSQASLQTIDLMQMPSVPVGRYNGYSSLRPFESSSIFTSQ